MVVVLEIASSTRTDGCYNEWRGSLTAHTFSIFRGVPAIRCRAYTAKRIEPNVYKGERLIYL